MTKHSLVLRVMGAGILTMTFAVAFQPIARAQAESNPVTAAARQMLSSRQPNVIGAAEAMPEDKYGFKPTPQQMSFGHLIEHIASSNYFLCSKLAGEAPPKQQATEKDGKAKLTAAVKDSFDYCSGVLNKLTDSRLGEPVELFGGIKGTKATALLYLTSGWADHYSAEAMYLRLNGLKPPTAKEKD
jgi:hypothetical protein